MPKPAVAATVDRSATKSPKPARKPKPAPTAEELAALREWNSTARIARYLDCSESTVRDWIARGLLPAAKAGRRRIVARDAVLNFIRRPGIAA